MKISVEKTVPFYGVDQDLALYPNLLLDYFQDAVGEHSKRAKDEAPLLLKKGNAWILSRIGLHIHTWPKLDDRLTITTWHTKDKGFKAFRDFQVTCAGKPLVSARTMWLFIDLHKKKILRIPKATSQAYESEEELPSFDMDINTWAPAAKFSPERICDIGIRSSDFDPLGHVNNAMYFDFLHHALASEMPCSQKPDRIMLQYVKEIPRQIKNIQVGVLKEGDEYLFKIFSDACIHAAGKFTLKP